MPDCDVTLMFQLRLRNILKRINATRIKEKMRFLNCESYPCPFRRVMSTEIVLQVVCSSTLAVDSVASLTIPMYPKTDPDRLINGHLTHNISFTHSEYFYSASSSPLLLRGTPPNYSIDTVSKLHAEALQATVCDGLAQGPYVVARVGFEPAAFWMQGTKHTT